MTELTSVPSSIVAGDGYIIDLTYPDYLPADGYTGVLYLRGIQVLRANGSTNGDAHRFTLSSTSTATLAAGTYEYSVGFTKAGNRVTVTTGFITVKADYATAGTRISHIEKTLQAIEAVIEGRITDDVQNLSIAGRSIQNIPIMELMELRGMYTKELSALKGTAGSVRKTVRLNFGGVR
jgi:hypothetical protein